jgi:hypothetical protein
VPDATRQQVRAFQEAWNRFVRRFGLHYKQLKVDGVPGKLTRVAIKKARFFLGVGFTDWQRNDDDVTPELLKTVADPFRRVRGYTRRENRRRRRVASARRKARVERWKAQQRPKTTAGVVYMDGKPVAAWIAKWAIKARVQKLWFGVIVSGWRDPVYSESLCLNMCGAPRCPGRCAGRSSNHAGNVFPAGAIDVSLFWQFRDAMRRLGAPLRNALPNDLVHFSNSGI